MRETWLRRIVLLNIIVQSGIIVTGAIVRVTESGLGCPTWPQCVEGSYVPTATQAESWHKYVEFGNRLLTFVVGLAALALIVAVFRFTKTRALRLLAATPLLGTIGQAVLGGITVLTGLHPATVMAHFLLSIVLVGLCVLLWVKLFRPQSPNPDAYIRLLRLTLIASSAVVIILGTIVTGSGPHSGDADATSRFHFDQQLVSWLHADAVWLFVGIIFATWIVAFARPAINRTALIALTVTTVAQGGIGYVQHFTGLPELLVILHVLGAVLLWNFTLFTASALNAETPHTQQ